MSRKTSQPALYEKFASRAGTLSTPTRIEPKLVASSEPSTPWLTPGRSIRVPVGYVLLAGALVLGLLFGTYIFSFNRGTKTARAEFEQELLRASNALSQATLVEPLTAVPPSGGGPAKAGQPNRPSGSGAVASRDPSRWGPLISDPRVKGMNYFVLVEGSENGAVKLAEFCRGNGLETYVVSGKNDRLRRVIAFPGFQSSARSSAEVKALEAKIHQVGDQWKKSQRGTDLRDSYPSLFNG